MKKPCSDWSEILKDNPLIFDENFWGVFDCGNGWFELVKELCASIQEEGLTTGDFCKVLQVKEKHGALRFYVDTASEVVYGLIDQAEEASMEICEQCGDPASLKQEGEWYTTRCDNCWEKENEGSVE